MRIRMYAQRQLNRLLQTINQSKTIFAQIYLSSSSSPKNIISKSAKRYMGTDTQ